MLDPLATFRLDDKVALVTGASAGLGSRFARVLDAVGATVVVAARRTERLESLVAELRDGHAVATDLADESAAAGLVDAVLERLGRIDVLVNNAGIDNTVDAIDTAMADFRREMQVNLIAPFELARLVARHAIDAGRAASIVNIGSIMGAAAAPVIPMAGYTASKGGLHNLTRELGIQWARKGVRVNTIAPGWFFSEMTEGRMFGDEAGEGYVRRFTPMGRGGAEGELDGALVYLASDASTYVTGATLFVDGGWSAQ